MCAEILSGDIYAIIEIIFQSDTYLDKLFGFWAKPKLNHHLAGYVNKITCNLLTKRKSDVILLFTIIQIF